MQYALEQFYENPTGRRYRDVRKVLRREKMVPVAMDQLHELHRLVDAEDFPGARVLAEEMLPAWCLSPRLHYLAATAAEQEGDPEDAELEQFLFHACMAGLLDTGDGSCDRPYLATYLSDLEDVLMALSLESNRKQFVQSGSDMLAVVPVAGRKAIHFDVTECSAAVPQMTSAAASRSFPPA